MKYLPTRKAAKMLGIHPNTLRRWADSGKISTFRTDSGHRRYDVESYLNTCNDVKTVCYCRVSSYKQKDDLERQVSFMQTNYPDAEIVKDVGSGINYKRKGMRTILERSMRGEKLRVISAYRDRLARFGYDLLKWIIEHSGGELVVLNERSLSPEQELTSDLITILHVFSCRIHGLRSYKNKIIENITDGFPAEDIQTMDGRV